MPCVEDIRTIEGDHRDVAARLEDDESIHGPWSFGHAGHLLRTGAGMDCKSQRSSNAHSAARHLVTRRSISAAGGALAGSRHLSTYPSTMGAHRVHKRRRSVMGISESSTRK